MQTEEVVGSSPSHAPPLALVVDDDPGHRSAKVTFLERIMNFRVISAESLIDARRELDGSPLVDVLITDVNLVESDAADCSGIALAREVKRLHPGLPVFGYSGKFEPDMITEEVNEAFDGVLLKGAEARGGLKRAAEEWKHSALAHRARRRAQTDHEIQRLTQKYALSKQDVWLLREFLPTTRAAAPNPESNSIDDVLRVAGYRLRIVHGAEVQDDISESVNVSQPIPVWVHESNGSVEAEVYGFPELYASGGTETEAVREVLLLMDGFRRDLIENGDDVLAPGLLRLRDYLRHVLR